jgi:hypothetical protein
MNLRYVLRTTTLTIWSLAAGLGVGTAAHAATTPTPQQEGAACMAVYAFHQTDTRAYVNRALWERERRHAWNLAGYADPALRTAIRHYLFTDHDWARVVYDCGFSSH